MRLQDLQTPCLLLDEYRMKRNIARLKARLVGTNVILRPHLKTAKSVDVARHLMESFSGPATVSTLYEAEQFAACGVTDILYAVGISPKKLDRVAALRRRGIDLSIILDSVEQADAVAVKSRDCGEAIPVLIEIDCDGHRSGIKPGDPVLLEIARRLQRGASLRGVLTHAGGSYDCRSTTCIVQAAQREQAAAKTCAKTLRETGFSAPVVSIGSTPTSHFATGFAGITEVRAGVFVFFDLVMAGLGVCELDDIALTVLATVIGHQRDKGLIFVDAGWMAMSRDRGTAKQEVDQGYGMLCDIDGTPIPDVIVVEANQEHGALALRAGAVGMLPELAIGEMVRILPNHACATGAQHDRYHVMGDIAGEVSSVWSRFSGW